MEAKLQAFSWSKTAVDLNELACAMPIMKVSAGLWQSLSETLLVRFNYYSLENTYFTSIMYYAYM